MYLASKYALFAVIATAVNIAVQDAVTRLYGGPLALYASIAAGTVAGLVVKYVLDKRYIFAFKTRDLAHDGRLFVLYTLMGVVTTAVFWGTELGFEFVFRSRGMRYLGGVIGLAIGYVVKYRLDRRFVFIDRTPAITDRVS